MMYFPLKEIHEVSFVFLKHFFQLELFKVHYVRM